MGVKRVRADDDASKLRLMLEINRRINSPLGLEEVLNFILDSARGFIPYDAAAIYLFDPVTRTVRHCVGSNDGEGESTALPLTGAPGIVGQVIATGEGALVTAADRPHYPGGRARGRSQMAAPISSDGQVIGALGLESNRPDSFGRGDLEWLTMLATQAALCIDKLARRQELLEKKRMGEELRIAREVQLSLLPAEVPKLDGLDIAGLNIPSKDVGGDYFDFIPIVAGHLGVVVADVVGKGVPAALIMASFRAVLRAEIRNNYAIRTIFAKVNNLLHETLKRNQYVSAFYGVLDLKRRRFTYSNAGHHPAILLRPGGKLRYLESGGLALGLFEGASYQEQFIDLAPGDLFFLYTDGLVEAENQAGEMFGRERLERFVRAHAHLTAGELCQAIYAEMRRFTQDDHLEDDTTIVVAKVLLTPREAV